MARKTKQVLIDYGTAETNRDFGKVFLLTEMAAEDAEWWAVEALSAVARSGVDLPDNIMGGGMQSIAIVGINAIMHINPKDVKGLFDEMMECVQVIPDPAKPKLVRDLMSGDIEEVGTRLLIRKEVLDLHVGFSQLVGQSTPTSSAALSNSLNTPTSQDPSVRFSRKG